MMVGEGGDLRQVGDTEHLIGACQRLKFFAHGLGCATSNAAVDFVEDQRALWR